MIGRTDQAYDLAVACFHALEPFQAKEAAEKPGRAGQQDAARGFRRRIERNRFERFSVQKRGDIEVPGMKPGRSEEHTTELQSLMSISYAVFCLKTKKTERQHKYSRTT